MRAQDCLHVVAEPVEATPKLCCILRRAQDAGLGCWLRIACFQWLSYAEATASWAAELLYFGG